MRAWVLLGPSQPQPVFPRARWLPRVQLACLSPSPSMGMSRGGRFLFHLIAGGEDKRGDASRNFQVLGVPLLACRVRTEDTDRGNQATEKEKWGSHIAAWL